MDALDGGAKLTGPDGLSDRNMQDKSIWKDPDDPAFKDPDFVKDEEADSGGNISDPDAGDVSESGQEAFQNGLGFDENGAFNVVPADESLELPEAEEPLELLPSAADGGEGGPSFDGGSVQTSGSSERGFSGAGADPYREEVPDDRFPLQEDGGAESDFPMPSDDGTGGGYVSDGQVPGGIDDSIPSFTSHDGQEAGYPVQEPDYPSGMAGTDYPSGIPENGIPFEDSVRRDEVGGIPGDAGFADGGAGYDPYQAETVSGDGLGSGEQDAADGFQGSGVWDPSGGSAFDSDSGMNSAYDGDDGFAGAADNGDGSGELGQDEAINRAVPSEKGESPADGHKNLAMYLNRNMLFMAVAGFFVVIILFFSVVLPILRPEGKQKAREFASAGGVVPKEVMDIPDGIAVALPVEEEPVPVEEEPEKDFSELFPDPSVPTTGDYTYDYTVSGGGYEAEEYDSSADVQQVGFSDVELTEDPTAAQLKAGIAEQDAVAAQNLIAEYRRKQAASTWMPYRPAEGFEDEFASSPAAALSAQSSEASGGTPGMESLYAQMLANSGSASGGPGQVYSYDQQNAQAAKGKFRQNAQTSAGNYKYNSSNSLWKGTIIPAVLDTSINTDLPGMVVATVTQNVYSSYDGKYLLIPQGSKVYAEYNSSISYNQSRVQIAWNTLIRPDGLEISLGGVDGVDSQGHAGMTGKVSRHPFEYAKAMAMIALFSIVNTKIVNLGNSYGKGKGQNGEDLTNDYYENLFSDLQGQASSLSGNMISRALDIQPTIAIEAGERVNLITNVTMVLPPLQPDVPKRKYVRKE